MTLVAITRGVGPHLGDCELSFIERQIIDIDHARAQHRAYVETLVALGCHVVELPSEPDMPDAVFVEDTAVVLDELALIMRPGTVSRRKEGTSVASALAHYRPLQTIEAPAHWMVAMYCAWTARCTWGRARAAMPSR
jgi:dimethylargininase